MSQPVSVWLPTPLSQGDTLAFGEGEGVTFVSLHDGETNHVCCSTNDGERWTYVDRLPEGCCVTALAVTTAGVYAGTLQHGVLFSDGGKWITAGAGLPDGSEVVTLAFVGATLFAGTRSKGIFRLDGAGWLPMNDGLPVETGRACIVALAAIETGLIASEATNLFRRPLDGDRWWGLNPCLPAARIPLRLRTFERSVVYGWGAHGVYRSDDGGDAWLSLADHFWQKRFVRGLITSPSAIYACTQGEETSNVFRSRDGGASWEAFGEGLPQPVWTQTLALSGNVLMAGAGNYGVWRRHLDADRRRLNLEPPFVLHQNEPNPFFKETRIRFTMRADGEVELNLLGLRDQIVRSLFSGVARKGVNEIVLEDGSLDPGIYTYRLTSGGIAQSRRLVLLG